MVTIGLLLVGLLLALYYFIFVRRGEKKDRSKARTPESVSIQEVSAETDAVNKKPEARLVHIGSLCPWQSAVLKKECTIIGRAKQNDIVIPRKTISSRHATIEDHGGSFFLEDQGSTNGTWLNDTRIKPRKRVALKNGDRISFADTVFKFEVQDRKVTGQVIMLRHSFLALDTAHRLADASPAKEDPQKQNATQPMIVDEESLFRECLCNHLDRIIDLGPDFESFVNSNFSANLINRLSLSARETMERATSVQKPICIPLARSPILFNLCSLPYSVKGAKQWFKQIHGGLIKYIDQSTSTAELKASGCNAFCLIAYGRTSQAWLSLTLFQSSQASKRIEIIATDLMTDAENSAFSLEFGHLD
jgi:pSer/pThr/pTyr-binding forkhead associated (FHA) protein